MNEHDFMGGADELVAKALTRKNDGQAALLDARAGASHGRPRVEIEIIEMEDATT